MKHVSLRRLAALLLALTLLIGCASAESAFWNNVGQKISGTDLNEKQIVLTAFNISQGQDLTASLQQKDGLVSLVIASGKQEVAVLQTDGQTIWLAVNGEVYALPVSELQRFLADLQLLNPLYLLSTQGASEDLSQILTLLAQNVLLPGIAMTAGENGAMVITVNLTGRQILDGLALTMETIADQADFSKLDAECVRVWSMWYAAYVETANVQNAPATLEEFHAYAVEEIRKAAAQLRETQLDLTIEGEITIERSATPNGACALTVTYNGQPVHFDGTLRSDRSSGEVALTVYNDQQQFLHAGITWYQPSYDTTLIDATIVAGNTEITLAGTIGRKTGGFDVDVSDSSGAIPATHMFLRYAETDDGLIIDCNLGALFTLNLFVARGRVRADAVLMLSGKYHQVSFTLREDARGRHPWKFSYRDPMNTYAPATTLEWDGEILTVKSNGQTIAFSGREISDTQYAIDEKLLDSDGSVTDQVSFVFTLTDQEDGNWNLTFDFVHGDTSTKAAELAVTEQTEVEPLSEKVTVELDEEALVKLCMQLIYSLSGRSNVYAY